MTKVLTYGQHKQITRLSTLIKRATSQRIFHAMNTPPMITHLVIVVALTLIPNRSLRPGLCPTLRHMQVALGIVEEVFTPWQAVIVTWECHPIALTLARKPPTRTRRLLIPLEV